MSGEGTWVALSWTGKECSVDQDGNGGFMHFKRLAERRVVQVKVEELKVNDAA